MVRLVRGEALAAHESHWDPYSGQVDRAVIEDADVVAAYEVLGNERAVVEVTKAPCPIVIGVMAGRTAKRIGDRFAAENEIGRGQGGEG